LQNCVRTSGRDENFCERAPFLQDLMGFAKIKYSNLKALTKIKFLLFSEKKMFLFLSIYDLAQSALLLPVDARNMITPIKKRKSNIPHI
jgi:hypothetical protein